MPVFANGVNAITVNTSYDTYWHDRAFPVDGSSPHPSLLGFFHQGAYGLIYERQPLVRRVIDKYVKEFIKLPFKTYERVPDGFGGEGRDDARDSLYGQLLTMPHPHINRVLWLSWVVMTYYIYGESFLYKVRDGRDFLNDRGGIPIQLLPIHPTKIRYGPPGGGFDPYHDRLTDFGEGDGENRWWISNDDGSESQVPRYDLVHWCRPNPHSMRRGLSILETLRGTLEDEWAMREARNAQWRNGGRPAFVLEYEKEWLEGSHASERLRQQFADAHGGPFNSGKPLILEDGLTAKQMPPIQDLDYIDGRKFNAAEVVSQFDMPHPAVGIHDASSYNNVEELMQSLARDTLAPELNSLEAALEFDLRDGRFGVDGEPDFSPEYFQEFEMSGVARGTFAERIAANARQIQTGQATINEIRRQENRPPVEGGDKVLVNSAVITIEEATQRTNQPGGGIQVSGDGGDMPVAAGDESDQRSPLIGPGPMSVVMGRLSRQKDLSAVDIDAVVAGIEPTEAEAVKACYLLLSDHMDGTVPQLREAIRKLRF